MGNNIKFPPQKLIEIDDGRKLIIGVNGEIQILDQELEIIFEEKKPFPTSISHSSVSSETLFAFWIDLELMIARMAAFNLNEEISEGPSRSELRMALAQKKNVIIKGANWSHILDSEPLSIVSNDEKVIFTTWKRGLYCIDHDSNELWRSAPLKWESTIKESHFIISMHLTKNGLFVWSKGAEWILINVENGDLIEKGKIEFPHILENVFIHDEKTLLCSNDGHMTWFDNFDFAESISTREKGPIHDAKWDSDLECWRLCIWRQDIIWSKSSKNKKNREEIGKTIFHKNDKWMVLDNCGNFSEHLS